MDTSITVVLINANNAMKHVRRVQVLQLTVFLATIVPLVVVHL